MRKLIILTIVLVMAMATASFATYTRVVTMGNNNNILLDDANVWLYPSRINQYPNLAIAEISDYDDEMYQFGVHWKFNESNPWVLGTYITTGMDVYPSSYPTSRIGWYDFGYGYYEYTARPSGSADFSGGSTNRRIDLLYGRKFGTTMFGFGLDYIHNSDSWEQDTLNPKLSFTQFTFAFGLTPEKGNWDVSLAFSMGSWKDQDEFGNDQTKPDGYYDLMVSGRYFHQMNPTVNLVPHAAIAMGKHGQKVDSATVSAYSVKSSRTVFDLGCGLHYMPTTNVLAVLDFGFLYSKISNTDIEWLGYQEQEDRNEKVFDMPYWKLGLEGEVFNWMDIRFGAVSEWQSFKAEWKYDPNPYKESSNWAENTTYLGFGLNFNRLHIDTYTDPEIILDGFNFISGSSDSEDLNVQVSVLYEMF